MNVLTRLMAMLGYVRIKDYGYALTPDGRIVEVPRVVDDRFEPPPFRPVAWQDPLSLLPPAPKAPPVPRPLPPPPDDEVSAVEPEPLFAVPAALGQVETAPPGQGDSAGTASRADAAARAAAQQAEEAAGEEESEEEWEWRMALARARADADKKPGAARPSKPPPRSARPAAQAATAARTAPLAAPSPASSSSAPAKSAAPVKATAPARSAPAKTAPIAAATAPAKTAPVAAATAPAKTAPVAAATAPAKTAPIAAATAPAKTAVARTAVARTTPAKATAARTTAPAAPARSPASAGTGAPAARAAGPATSPAAATGSRAAAGRAGGERPMTTARTVPARGPRPARAAETAPASPARASLEKSVRKVFAPTAPATPTPRAAAARPGGARLARGTHGPERIAQPVVGAALADGSGDHPSAGDETRTDLAAVDRARASMRDEEETRVNLTAAPASDTTSTIDLALEDDDIATCVETTSPMLPIAALEQSNQVGSSDSPLPRLTARLRRTAPN